MFISSPTHARVDLCSENVSKEHIIINKEKLINKDKGIKPENFNMTKQT